MAELRTILNGKSKGYIKENGAGKSRENSCTLGGIPYSKGWRNPKRLITNPHYLLTRSSFKENLLAHVKHVKGVDSTVNIHVP